MTDNTTHIRNASLQDHDAILRVHRSAFGPEEGTVIAELLDEMLEDSSAEPRFSIVATFNEEIVGHILFTSVVIEPRHHVVAQILAPLAVSHSHQGQGIGHQLVEAGLFHLKDAGVELVFVLGYPDYYTRFGFSPAGVHGFNAPFPIAEKNAAAWMVQALQPGTLQEASGTVRCCESLNQEKYWIE